jgi:type III secretion system YscQ/HrcQ family protein
MKREGQPYSWIRRLAHELPELESIPLFGKAPPIDWEQISLLLTSRFGVESASLRAKEQTWREGREIKAGLGAQAALCCIAVSPMGEAVYWAMDSADMAKLVSWMLYKKAATGRSKGLSEVLEEGFYRYLLLEALDAVSDVEPLAKLTFQLEDEAELPKEASFCIDIELDLDSRSFWGRLIVPASFRKAWIEHFANYPDEYHPSDAARLTELTIGVRAGSTQLSGEEWEAFKEGDFLVLDKSSFDPSAKQGVGTLFLGSTPLFQARIGKNAIELIDYAFTYEETMDQKGASQPLGADEESTPIKELPMTIHVELARFKMTLDELMHLTPGNKLELPVHPDQGVALTVGGRKIGTAELIYLGETLGLRILDMG